MGKIVKRSEITKNKPYDETALYKSSIDFLCVAHEMVKNIEKFDRECVGMYLIRKINAIIHSYKKAYITIDISEKIKLFGKIIGILDSIGTDIKVLRAIKAITDKQYGKIILKYGPVYEQSENFINALNNKLLNEPE